MNSIIINLGIIYTVNFASRFDDPHVLTSSSGSNTARAVYSLMCSSTLSDSILPSGVTTDMGKYYLHQYSAGDPEGRGSLPLGPKDHTNLGACRDIDW